MTHLKVIVLAALVGLCTGLVSIPAWADGDSVFIFDSGPVRDSTPEPASEPAADDKPDASEAESDKDQSVKPTPASETKPNTHA